MRNEGNTPERPAAGTLQETANSPPEKASLMSLADEVLLSKQRAYPEKVCFALLFHLALVSSKGQNNPRRVRAPTLPIQKIALSSWLRRRLLLIELLGFTKLFRNQLLEGFNGRLMRSASVTGSSVCEALPLLLPVPLHSTPSP